MRAVDNVEALRSTRARYGEAGETTAFVPTMGALHEGHFSLVRLARNRAQRVVVSVFVNPMQFGPGEDFETYPRDPERDAALLESEGVDLLFLPSTEVIYPTGHATTVEPGGAALGLEGSFRPGHFAGVATVVTQLFHLVEPELAVFGEKDAQQLAVIRQVVRDLHLDVEIVPGPTIREEDGLALSSRNTRLLPEDRHAATVLYRALEAARLLIEAGERRADAVRARMQEVLATQPRVRVEYAEVVSAKTFERLEILAGSVVLPTAAWVGEVRLIDNIRVPLDEV
jgi:pantoate--beta-alanine ligase